MTELRDSLKQMHKRVADSVSKAHDAKRRATKKRRRGIDFDKGDYVLVGASDPENLSKLQPRWTGLYQIVQVISDWVFVVRHLITKAEKNVHSCRLSYHADKHLNVTIRMQEQIQHDEAKFEVESLIDLRQEGKE